MVQSPAVFPIGTRLLIDDSIREWPTATIYVTTRQDREHEQFPAVGRAIFENKRLFTVVLEFMGVAS